MQPAEQSAKAHDGDFPPTYDEATDGESQPAFENGESKGEKEPAGKSPEKQQHLTGLSKPPAIPPGPLTFKVLMRKPFLDPKTITLTPLQPIGNISYWNMRYWANNKTATLSRHAPYPQDKFPVRDIAEISYAAPLLSHPYGILVKFRPSEAEIESKGERHVSTTDRMMLADGYLTTTYAIDPVLGTGLRERMEWRVLPVEKKSEHQPQEKTEKGASSLVISAESSRRPWTPFSTQTLVEELSGDVLATFTHAAPFAKETGTLTIPQDSEPLAPETVEAIITICAAMVGFQDKAGLTSLLIESGYEYVSMKGKNKA